MGIMAVSAPFIVVPIREALGYNVNHYRKRMDPKKVKE
jgi:hypothetical protein